MITLFRSAALAIKSFHRGWENPPAFSGVTNLESSFCSLSTSKVGTRSSCRISSTRSMIPVHLKPTSPKTTETIQGYRSVILSYCLQSVVDIVACGLATCVNIANVDLLCAGND
jgi:hypothetical protein